MKKIQFNVDDDDALLLSNVAKEKGQSVAQLVKFLIGSDATLYSLAEASGQERANTIAKRKKAIAFLSGEFQVEQPQAPINPYTGEPELPPLELD